MDKKIYCLDIRAANQEFLKYLDNSGKPLPVCDRILIMRFIAENMDANMALASTYWTPAAVRSALPMWMANRYTKALNNEVLNSLAPALQAVGLILYHVCWNSHVFRTDLKESFPYLVLSVSTDQLIIEEDLYLIHQVNPS